MIIEGLCQLFCNVLLALFSGIDFIKLPFELIGVLANIMAFGTWVVGSDLLLIFGASVTLWLGVRWSFNLAVWVYERLPLT